MYMRKVVSTADVARALDELLDDELGDVAAKVSDHTATYLLGRTLCEVNRRTAPGTVKELLRTLEAAL
jgi:hypothetical protein